MTGAIRGLRGRDVRQVLGIERRAFPEDPWTLTTARGWLARSPIGGHPRRAARLARLIRLARVNEAISLVKLIRLLVLHRPAGLRYVVAERGSTITGYACLSAAGARGDVQMIAVRSDHQGQGIGTALLECLIATAAACGCGEVCLYVRADNHRARLLYQRTGFVQTGLRPGYYQPSGTDAVVMTLPLARRRSAPDGAVDDHEVSVAAATETS